MFTIDNDNRITVTRGDTFSLPLILNAGTDFNPVLYELEEGDTIYVAVMEPNQPFECALVKKVLTSGSELIDKSYQIKFNSSDTECLQPGNYYYQIKARFKNSDGTYNVNTVVPKTEFWIEE